MGSFGGRRTIASFCREPTCSPRRSLSRTFDLFSDRCISSGAISGFVRLPVSALEVFVRPTTSTLRIRGNQGRAETEDGNPRSSALNQLFEHPPKIQDP